MKNILTIVILGAIIFLGKNFYDSRYERAMVGTWESNMVFTYPQAKLELEFEETYLKDGTSSGDGKFLMYINNQFLASAVVRTETTWKVEGDTIVETLTSMKMGKYRGDGRATEIFDEMRNQMKKEINQEMETEILSLRGGQMKLEDENGIVVFATRK